MWKAAGILITEQGAEKLGKIDFLKNLGNFGIKFRTFFLTNLRINGKQLLKRLKLKDSIFS
jgi:hypothetical protein